MKKFLTMTIMTVLILMMVFTLTGCGEKTENNAGKSNENVVPNISNTENTSGTKLEGFARLYSGESFYMKYKMTVEGKETIIEISKKGDKIASSSAIDGVISNVIMDGDNCYIVMHDQKMIMQTTKTQNMEDIYDEGLEDITIGDIVKGTETINGKNYEYEEYDTVRYYFEGSDLKYMKSEGNLIEIVETSTNSKDSLFEMPDDYTEMSY